MKFDALPSPGYIGSGLELQKQCVKAISYTEVMASLKGGKTEQAKSLTTFFTACIAAVAAFVDAVLPTFVSAVINRTAAPKTLTITLSEPLMSSVVPSATAFTTTGGGNVQAVEIVGSTVVLTNSANFNGSPVTVTYVQPASNGVRDLSGNLVASFTSQPVTNNA
jgi:hypothetical protein